MTKHLHTKILASLKESLKETKIEAAQHTFLENPKESIGLRSEQRQVISDMNARAFTKHNAAKTVSGLCTALDRVEKQRQAANHNDFFGHMFGKQAERENQRKAQLYEVQIAAVVAGLESGQPIEWPEEYVPAPRRVTSHLERWLLAKRLLLAELIAQLKLTVLGHQIAVVLLCVTAIEAGLRIALDILEDAIGLTVHELSRPLEQRPNVQSTAPTA
jgi:hypothetical protein